jgi:hypothetical protein
MPLPSAEQVIEALETAAEENQLSPLRHEQVIHLPSEGQVWMTGDMHDHRHNFNKLLRAADLPNHSDRHLILHELIHGDHIDSSGAEDSWQILFRAAELKCDYSSQVHFLLANHDLAQIFGEGIMKAGLSVCEAFNAGVQRDFGKSADQVTVAITEFLLSFPLAARTTTGLFFSHSLPSESQIAKYDYGVFDRPLTGADYKRRTGPAYQLIWGRNMPPEAAADFADHVGAQIVVTGHQPQDSGYTVNGERHLIIASDHNLGVFLPLELSESYEMPALVDRLERFAAIA